LLEREGDHADDRRGGQAEPDAKDGRSGAGADLEVLEKQDRLEALAVDARQPEQEKADGLARR
jgi:hypothetical protein